jgi:hypothetical protein
MYDCQTDRYTDFSLAHPQGAVKHSLQGTLTAHPLPFQAPAAAFDALEALAFRHGYEVERCDNKLKVVGINLADALNFNACFASQLVIDCDLRHARPVPFNPIV